MNIRRSMFSVMFSLSVMLAGAIWLSHHLDQNQTASAEPNAKAPEVPKGSAQMALEAAKATPETYAAATADAPLTVEVIHVVPINDNWPAWVKNEITWFNGQDYSKERAAFQRPFAWGTVTLNGETGYWFAYCNTDAYLQFNFSVKLTDSDLAKIKLLLDKEKRNWEFNAKIGDGKQDQDAFGPVVRTWIGATNDWADPVNEGGVCNSDFTVCDNNKAVDDYVAAINGATDGRITMKVGEYLK